MSNTRQKKLNTRNRLLAGFVMALVLAITPWHLGEAFQIRQADSLRVMQSKPYATSTNFQVDANIFIKPNKVIRLGDTVAQVVPPTPSVSSAPPSSTPSSNGGGGGGGEKYSASKWLLAKKYDELVRARDEGDEPYLTSAPEDPSLKFDYVPTRPGEIMPFIPGKVLPGYEVIPPTYKPTTPSILNTVQGISSVLKANVLPAKEDKMYRAKEVLIRTPINPVNVTVVDLNTRQKKNLLKSQSNGFNWPWAQKREIEERWQASAPVKPNIQSCINCADVLWWSWCEFVVICLVLILLLVLLNTILQILMFRFRLDRFKPDNPRTLKYKTKKLLQKLGLLSVLIFVGNVSLNTASAAETTPQLLIYEGELLDDLGAPATGSYTFRFSFWDNSDFEATDVVGGVLSVGAGDYLGWNEVQTATTLADGSFSIKLSDVTPFVAGMFDQDTLYLQVEVKASADPDTSYEFVDINLGSPTEDRKIIASVPFAFNANKLDYRDLGFGAGNIPYLDVAGLVPESVIPDLNLTSADLDLADITLSDFTNDLVLADTQIFVGDGTNVATGVAVSGDATIDNTGVFSLATDAVSDNEIDYTNVTLTDFTNDAGFVTTDTDTLGGLTCAANEIAKWSGAAWICAPDAGGSAFTASDGITLTGSNFTNDFSTSIEGSEITDGTIGAVDINLGDLTLADFTNDAGFLSTVDVSANTNLTAGTGATLTGDEISVDLGTTIATAEIEDDAVTAAKIGTAGAGDADKVLTTDGAGNPLWEDKSTFGVSSLTSGNIFVGNGTNVATDVALSGDATIDNTGALSLANDSVQDAEIDYTNVTLTDFTNDAGFVTTDNDTTYTGSGGITLTGTNFTADLGTTIATAEVEDNAITTAKIGTAGAGDADKILTTDIAGNPQWEDKSIFTTPALTSGNIFVGNGSNQATGVVMSGDATINNIGTLALVDDAVKDAEIDYTAVTLADFTNDAGFVTTDNDTTYNAGIGMNLVGTTFSTTLGTAIDSSEIVNGSVSEIDLNFGDITLSDFTNDAGFLTTVDISANTNLAAGAGLTLTGDSLSADLGSSIVSGEIVDGTIAGADLNLADITLADFTNDAGFVTTDNDTTYSAGTGINLVGTTFSSSLGTSIDATEIDANAVQDAEIDYTNVTLNDFTNDAGFLTTVDISSNTNLAAGSGIMLVGDSILADLGTDIVSGEIVDGTIGDADLDLVDITLADFTNDAGFITAEAQDLSLVGNNLSITGGSTIDLSVIDTDTLNTLSCSSGEVAKWNGSAWVCAPDSGGTSYTASDGVTLTGSNFTNDFGNSIESNEITDGTVADQDLNLTDITLADFTNDAGFLTTDNDTLGDLACATDEIARFNGTIWECAGGPVSITEVLTTRSTGLIFDADGTNNTGSMFEEEATTLSGILDNVLRWFSRQATLNDYDIVVQWTLPNDFDSFQASPIMLDYQTSGTVADAVIDMTVKHETDADDELISSGLGLNSNAWATSSFTIDGTTTWAAGETMKIRLRMKAKDSNSAQIGNIKIKYNKK